MTTSNDHITTNNSANSDQTRQMTASHDKRTENQKTSKSGVTAEANIFGNSLDRSTISLVRRWSMSEIRLSMFLAV